jgi:hypothetical protein
VSAVSVTGRYQVQTLDTDACLPSLTGTWRSDTTIESRFLEFTPEGWVGLHELAQNSDPPALEVLAQVPFQLTTSPEWRVEFSTARGNDVFPPGRSSWLVLAYDDLSFTTRDEPSQQDTRWVRVLTHRYFMTLAAIEGTGEHGGSAFATWTSVDGQRIVSEGLGLSVESNAGGGARTRFGRIPADLVEYFARDRARQREPMLRLELNEAEYYRTREVLKAWAARAALQTADEPAAPELARDFFAAVVSSLNRCASRLTLDDQPFSTLPRFVDALRSLNGWRHVADDQFPFVWQPPPIN